MAIRVTEARRGMVIRYENELYQITKYEHVTPGNWRAINHLYLKNLKTGRQKEVRMNSGDLIDPVFLEKKTCQYLYKDSTGYVFMDNESYEQFTLSPDLVADLLVYIGENSEVDVVFHETEAVTVELPSTVTLEVVEAEDVAKGNTVTSVQKTAKMNTGLQVKVPAHIKVGERIRISTETGEFLGRAGD